MPDGLNEDGVRAWETILPELMRMRIAGRPDGFTLEAFCRTYQLWRAHDGGRGYPTLTANLLSLANALGCTPAARLRMIVPEAEEDDEERNVFGTG